MDRKAIRAALGAVAEVKFARECEAVRLADLAAHEQARVLSAYAWVQAQRLMQDECRGLSKALAATPGAWTHAREAAADIEAKRNG